MALIALEFEKDEIFVAAARTAGKRTKIQSLFSVKVEGSDEDVAATLRGELSKQGLSRADALVVVSRSNAEVRLMEVPPSPDNELPDIVRFLARNEFASLNDNWLLDYVRLTGDQASTGQVLAAGVSPEMSNQVKAIVEKAGLRLRNMVLRPFAAVELMSDRMTPNTVHLLIDPNNGQTDLTIVDGATVVATRTVRVPADSDHADKLIPEIRRTIASSSRALGGKPINQIIVFGNATAHEPISEKLRARMDTDVTIVDPLKHAVVSSKIGAVESPTRYVALMGALVNHAARTRPAIDFLNPRKPVKETGNYQKWFLYGGLAAAVFLALGVLGWWTLRTQSIEIAELKNKVESLRRKNEGKLGGVAVKTTLAEVGKIDDWMLKEVNWQEQLLEYSSHALTADETIVDLFTASSASTRSDGSIAITARTSDFEAEKNLINALSEPFLVTPMGSDRLEDDRDYPILSNLKMKLAKDSARLIELDKIALEHQRKQAEQRQQEALKRQQQKGDAATHSTQGNTTDPASLVSSLEAN